MESARAELSRRQCRGGTRLTMHTLDSSGFNADPSTLQIQRGGFEGTQTDHAVNRWGGGILFFGGAAVQPG